jgi:hypothetical protein
VVVGVLAGSLFLTLSAAAIDPVVYCGVVRVNSITSGQGSGPRTLELQVTSGPAGGGRFSVPASIPFPTVGSYMCGQFEQGVPMNGLVGLLSPGDPGFVGQLLTPTLSPEPSAVPGTTAPPQASIFTLGFIELLLLALAVLVVMGIFTLRSRRATA